MSIRESTSGFHFFFLNFLSFCSVDYCGNLDVIETTNFSTRFRLMLILIKKSNGIILRDSYNYSSFSVQFDKTFIKIRTFIL